jgi:hypothetical protein
MSLEKIERAVALGLVGSEVEFLKMEPALRAAILSAVDEVAAGTLTIAPAPTEEQWHVIRDADGNVVG